MLLHASISFSSSISKKALWVTCMKPHLSSLFRLHTKKFYFRITNLKSLFQVELHNKNIFICLYIQSSSSRFSTFILRNDTFFIYIFSQEHYFFQLWIIKYMYLYIFLCISFLQYPTLFPLRYLGNDSTEGKW